MSIKPLVFWGAAGHAKVLREVTDAAGYACVAVFDNNTSVTSPFADVPVHHGWEGFLAWRKCFPGECWFLAAMGGLRGNPRMVMHEKLEAAGLKAATVVHPSASVAPSAVVGAGSQILAGAAVTPEARIGKSCIVNTRASVDHESVLGDGVHVAPGAVICGCVTIGDGCFIGAGSVVIHNVKIGAGTIVGAGAVVTHDVPANVVVVGNPARVLRPNT